MTALPGTGLPTAIPSSRSRPVTLTARLVRCGQGVGDVRDCRVATLSATDGPVADPQLTA
jgi:hypothetical protein